jgi:hypothetical protein
MHTRFLVDIFVKELPTFHFILLPWDMARSPMVDFCYTVALTAVTKRVV